MATLASIRLSPRHRRGPIGASCRCLCAIIALFALAPALHAQKSPAPARLVGQTTAGAVLGGSPHILTDDSLLVIAVSDVLVNGVRLEGVAVAPQVEGDRPLPCGNNADPQFEASITELLAMLPPAP
jgi:C-terminal processing protease CtpA/Prc